MIKILTLIMLVAATACLSQGHSVPGFSGYGEIMMSRSGSTPSFETEGSTPRVTRRTRAEYREGKSPMVAAGLSLLLPGAGEFYGRDYLRSGIFFGIEVFTLSMWAYYNSEGNDKKDEYRSYADRNFDEDLYYGGLLGMSRNVRGWLEGKNGDDFSAADYWNYDYFSNRDNWDYGTTDSLSVRDMLTLSFGYYNGLDITLLGGSAQFTHNLPATKTQQYYEMIGKYQQFSCGWNDFEGYVIEDGVIQTDSLYIKDSSNNDVLVVIPKFIEGEFNYGPNGYISPQVNFYEGLRDVTNQTYEKGQNFLMLTLLNHVASAFNASYVIKSRYQIDTAIQIENNDKSQKIGLDNYKLTYSVRW